MYMNNWLAGVPKEDYQSVFDVWMEVLEGIGDDQIDAGYESIRLGGTEFNTFPPSPQSFRQLCECFKTFTPALQLSYVYSPTEKTEALRKTEMQKMREKIRMGCENLAQAQI
jgi:hypothetical protein